MSLYMWLLIALAYALGFNLGYVLGYVRTARRWRYAIEDLANEVVYALRVDHGIRAKIVNRENPSQIGVYIPFPSEQRAEEIEDRYLRGEYHDQ